MIETLPFACVKRFTIPSPSGSGRPHQADGSMGGGFCPVFLSIIIFNCSFVACLLVRGWLSGWVLLSYRGWNALYSY